MNDDKTYREKLMIDNLNLMHKIFYKYKNWFMDESEYEECKEDFIFRYMKVCNAYDESLGFKISALLNKSIRNHVLRYIDDTIKPRRVCMFMRSMIPLDAMLNSGTYMSEILSVDKRETIMKAYCNEIKDYIGTNFSKTYNRIMTMYLEGYTQEEIAKVMGCSRQNINQKLIPMLAIIKKEFSEYKCV